MAKKASDHVVYYENENGPVIGTVNRVVIEYNGLFFKDIDGSGEVNEVADWRLPPSRRAAAYVKKLSLKEKVGQLFISDWRSGMAQKNPALLDESGLLDEGEMHGRTIFGEQHLPSTSFMLKEWWARHIIFRANPDARYLTDFLNQLQAVAEECKHFVPVQAASNSRNEHGAVVFGMNDAAGVFPTWPGTLGIAAAVRGEGNMTVAEQFADAVRRSWNATGLRKGYMYMADVMTDPRWQRSYGTFGEDPALVSEIFDHIIPRIQGSKEGVTTDGVAMTVKHFPGGGARENGFDPHYKAGQWNMYATEGSLQKYHLSAFRTAVKNNASSIMPYYSKPSKKSAVQLDDQGQPMDMQPFGFAYNQPFIQHLLRDQMGFKGYINSDTGIVHNMCWGVEMLDVPERIAFALNNGGVDLISGLFDIDSGMEALARAANDYYDTHPVPEGFRKEDVTLTEETVDRAVTRTLTEMFALGMFDNPYRDPCQACRAAAYQPDWDNAMDAHRKSVTVLKNDGILPLTADKLAGKKVYAEAFARKPEQAKKDTAVWKALLKDAALVEDPAQADIAVLLLSPSSGDYFHATPGYLELDICEGKMVCNCDEAGRPTTEMHPETTLTGANRLKEIAQAVHANGGKVIVHVNFTLAWQLGQVEPWADALTAGYDTYESAVMDVMKGDYAPVGKLPITLPRGDEVLAVNSDGICISPNDVPGYDKDLYMPDSMKDENGKAYAYRDAAGHYYERGFGLHW